MTNLKDQIAYWRKIAAENYQVNNGFLDNACDALEASQKQIDHLLAMSREDQDMLDKRKERIAVLEDALRYIATYTPPLAYLREYPNAELLINIARQALEGDAK